MKFPVILFAAVFAVQPAGIFAASAERAEGVEQVLVSYGDLNLRTPVGQQRLRNRIAFAAYQVCLANESASPSPLVADPACWRAAVNSGMQQMSRAVARAEGGRVVAEALILRKRN